MRAVTLAQINELASPRLTPDGNAGLPVVPD